MAMASERETGVNADGVELVAAIDFVYAGKVYRRGDRFAMLDNPQRVAELVVFGFLEVTNADLGVWRDKGCDRSNA